jgi:hypothetical protein
MRVNEIIERLQRDYTPDTQLVVLWWDKAQFDLPADDDVELTVEKWDELVQEFEWEPTVHEELLTAYLSEFVLEYLTERQVA